MTELERALRQIVGDLVEEGLAFALVGGLAVSARAEPRLTRDVDLAVSVESDQMAEQIVRALSSRGYVPDVVTEHSTGRLAAVRMLVPETNALVTDLLFATSGIEPEIVKEAELLEALPGFVVPVATTGYLIAMKLLARDDRLRPIDTDDLRALASIATEKDWSDAQSAVGLIEERGFARDRDLIRELQAARRQS